MGATYTRQSSAGITDGAVIEASDINDEFDQLLAAFVAASGHTHDGTAAEGGPVSKLLGTSLTLGDGTAGTDITVTFDGESSDGVLTWMEDEDLFKFSDAINVGVDDTGYDVKFFGATSGKYWLWDESADGVTQIGALTVGVDDAGHDVKFFGDTASAYMLWDTSADDLVLAGAAGIDLAGDIDVDGTANLDIVDIDGAVQVDSTITVGVDDQGYDIKFFGDTASAYMLWDTSADDLVLAGAAGIDLAGDIDVDGTANLDIVDIDGAVQIDNTVTVGVNDTGYDVKFFGATSGAYMLWDESTDDLVLAGASKLYLYDAAGGEYLSSSGSALTIASGGTAWELPAADGSADQYLKTDGSGNLDWATLSSGVSLSAANSWTAKQSFDLAAANITPATDGSHVHIEGGVTMTDTNTSGSGTASKYSQVSIEAITLAASNSSVTTTTASTLYISGSPTAGTNQTLTNAYALHVDAGTVQFDGDLKVGGDLTITGDDLTMSTNTSGAALIGDGTNFNPVAISGDIAIAANGTASIGSGVIVNADVNSSAAIADSKLATISTAGKVDIGALEIDGATDIGAALADADLFIVDDNAGGTEKKCAASRIITYVNANASFASEGTATALAIALG